MAQKTSINLFVPLVILIVLVGLGLAVWFGEQQATPPEQQAAEVAKQAVGAPFTATAEFSYQGLSFTADCNRTDANTLSLALTEPAELAGVKMQMADGKATVSYGEMAVTLDQSSFLGKSAAAVLLKALNAAGAESGTSFDLTETGATISGSNEDGDFSLTIDPSSGAIVSVSLPQEDFSGTFTIQNPPIS